MSERTTPASARSSGIFAHLQRIDALVARGTQPMTDPSLLGEAEGAAGAMGAVAWRHGGIDATRQDWDMDGIPNAFDHYNGAGAFAPGM